MTKRPPMAAWQRFAAAGLFLAVALAYSNHFHNGFHFDDGHSISDNPAIRSLGNLPQILMDASTSSVLPMNQTWRPLVTASLAIDYALAGGLRPFWFQLSTFLWYLALLAVLLALYRAALENSGAGAGAFAAALLAAAWFGLHPANAETVNYIIQRAEVLSTFGVAAGLLLYAARPAWRRYGLYLIPVAFALLAKAPALVFPALLFAWIVLFEDAAPPVALRRCLPALVLVAAIAILTSVMTPATFTPTGFSAAAYRLAQPLVIAHYFASFFLPLWLTADTDRRPMEQMTIEGIAAFAFLALLIAAAIWAGRRPRWRAVAFGLWWFLLALAPTSLFPLAEVENDHRMFFAFAGLALAVVAAADAAFVRRRRLLTVVMLPVLLLCASGVWQRNQVWASDEALWKDVTEKSPRNPRGLMNYGLTLMAKGETAAALDYFERALPLAPNYPLLEINLAIATGALGRQQEAESHFLRALQLAPSGYEANHFYARWLNQQGRSAEAAEYARRTLQLSPRYLPAHYELMKALAAQGEFAGLRAAAEDTLTVAPEDSFARQQLQQAGTGVPAIPATPESWLQRSLELYQSHHFEESKRAAEQSLALRPTYAEAYNNVAAANAAMGKWDDAIRAAQEALRLRPDMTLARNNLAWAEAEKRKAAAR